MILTLMLVFNNEKSFSVDKASKDVLNDWLRKNIEMYENVIWEITLF